MAIYQGVWYNHDVNKLILTLDSATAGFLTAAIVIWVQLVASATWPILRCLLYLARQSASSRDVFHHQRQVMLRNSSGAAGAVGELIMMAWRWRSYRARAFLRTVVYSIVCATIFVLWTVCGLYAPYIYTRTSSDGLLALSPHCGHVAVPTSPDNGQADVFNLFTARDVTAMSAANIYAQQCYGPSNTSEQCIQYPRPSLPFQILNDSCPFGNNGEVCMSVNSTVITLDTGHLDSERHFGINAKPSNTVQYRRVNTCSPLHTTDFVNIINTTNTTLSASYPPGEVLIQYLYGANGGYNFTFQYQYLQSMYPIAYTLESTAYSDGQEVSPDLIDWVPNSTFWDPARSTGDVSILFLAGNKVQYREPLYDAWFAAGLHAEDTIVIPFDATTNFTEYTSSRSVVPLACREQHQICLARSDSNCTPLIGLLSLSDEAAKLPGSNWATLATVGIISEAAPSTGFSEVVTALGSSALIASRTLSGVLQTATLPMDQWRLEVANLFSIGLARLQSVVLSYATGPADPAFVPYVQTPWPASKKYVCRAQRVQDLQGNINFDMAGLIVLVVVGVFLIALGLSFENLIGTLSKHSSAWSGGHARWVSDGLFQLHKASLEARGVTDWQKRRGYMPISTQLVDAEVSEAEPIESAHSLLIRPGAKR